MIAAEYAPPCPHCHESVTHKMGFTKKTGYRRFKCPSCGKSFSNSPYPRGSKPQGDKPKLKSVVNMRWRRKKKMEIL